MNRKIYSCMLIAFVLTIGLSTAEARKPLVGTMDLQFNLGYPGPQTEIPDWMGHITINGEVYGMVFFNIGSGKSFDIPTKGSLVFFEEIWVIYDSIDITFDENGVMTSWFHGSILLLGTDEGITNIVNSKYHMNGIVEEAYGLFQNYQGRNVHMSGDIIWYPFGAPQYAPGEFRIN